jgi:hypothetical protein
MKISGIPLGQTITLDFITSDPAYGTPTSASATTIRVFEDANDTEILTPTATERSGNTGNYRVQIACTTANGFEVGKSYNVVADVTVSGANAKAVIGSFLVVVPLFQANVVADGSNTATTFETDLTEATNDHWKDALLVFVTGSLAGQVKKITAYNGTTKFVTFTSGFTAAPSGGDKFILVNA